jgi:hypothetical protein
MRELSWPDFLFRTKIATRAPVSTLSMMAAFDLG